MRPWCALIALSLSGCPKGAPPSVAPADGLRFDWPDGGVGERRAERFSRREVGGERRERVIVASETVSVARDGTGWTIRVTDGRFDAVDGRAVEPVLAALAAVPQEVRIDANGGYAGLVDPQGWGDRAREAMHRVVDPNDVMAQIQVDLAVQPEKLDETLAREWRSLVGFWVGRPVVAGPLGRVDGFDARGEAAAAGAELSSVGVERCGPATCARLVARSALPADALDRRGAAVLAAWVSALPAPPATQGVDGLRGELVTEVWLDPATMLPHRYDVSEVLEGVVRVDDASMAFRDEEGKSVRWVWKP